jgi:hypothetical protein
MKSGLHYNLEQHFQSFHDFPIVTDLNNLDADVAILGIPFGDPYSMAEASNDQAFAPTHIRRHCGRALRGLDRYDFDRVGRYKLNRRFNFDIPNNKETRILRVEDLTEIIKEVIRLNITQ